MTFRPGTTLNPVDIVATLPLSATNGVCMTNDPRGTDPYIYVLFSATAFYRIDTRTWTWQAMAAPGAVIATGFGVGTCMTYTFAFNTGAPMIYAFGPGAGGGGDSWFASYTVSTNTWATRANLDGTLGATWGVDGFLVAPNSVVNVDAPSTSVVGAVYAPGNYVILNGNGAKAQHLYDVVANVWCIAPALPVDRAVAAGAGTCGAWLWASAPNRLYSLDGGGVGTAEYYNIATNAALTAVTPVPVFATMPSTGTSAISSCLGDKMYIRLNATGRIHTFDPTNSTVTPLATLYGTDGVATVGNKLAAYRVGDNEYLVAMLNNGTQLQRIRVPR